MGPRPEEGLDNETNFFMQCENEKEELTDYKEDHSKVEGEQILDAIGSTTRPGVDKVKPKVGFKYSL